MDYPTNIKKFLYSHYFFTGARQAIGVLLPTLVLFCVFDMRMLGLEVASGALCASIVDINGPLRHKHTELLSCTLLGTLTVFITSIATAAATWQLWVIALILTFSLSMLVVYGYRASLLSFACLMMMVLNVEVGLTHEQVALAAGAVLVGGLWYTYFSLAICRLCWFRVEQQTLAECFFVTAKYLEAKAIFYDTQVDLDTSYRQLISAQVTVVEKQQAAREIILRNMPRLQRGTLDKGHTMLFNLFINIVDLHEIIVAVHTDYAMLRREFRNDDILVFFRDMILKVATEVDTIGYAIAINQSSIPRRSWRAELRAIEYEIETMRKQNIQQHSTEPYQALTSTFRRVWSVTRIVERMHKNTILETDTKNTEMKIDQALSRFISHQNFSPKLLLKNLTFSSPSFRHALRMTIAITAAILICNNLPMLVGQTHSYWVLLTIIVILKPGFSLTKQKNFQRLSGTLIGCISVLAVLSFVHQSWILIGLMFFCMVMGNSLALFNYRLSVIFMSSYVLLLSHFLLPGSLSVIGERALDTAIGSGAALICSYLFPYWEYRLMGPLIRNAIQSTRNFIHASANRDDCNDFAYRLVRKDMHIAFGNFGAAFNRMMLEPKSKQVFVAELNELLVQNHALASHITGISRILAGHVQADKSGELAHVIWVIKNLLTQAADAPAAPIKTNIQSSSDALRFYTPRLDALVIALEQEPDANPEHIQAIKLITHQLKQMLRSSELILHHMRTIRLPG
ncbi:FUSC family protein [Candidatus Pandoraea novymonadis]|uniref:Inner membrane protein YccS n=1 Tax=Candidatus Pandoraea novymonadis TaxID=1808959 RepID=A0ABX5FF78_9BURK|nr:FUSC family protein [Candidatus Pandoraea novymonadis]PSB91682.1 Inner membrane protein YccS [Candidatus Pandoraea novymonadis]